MARFRPRFTVGLILLGGITAFLEGIGLIFIYPILKVAQSDGQISQANGILGRFLDVYEFLGIPFSLEFLILGVATAMTVRYSLSVIVAWLRVILQQTYEKTLRTQAFESALTARISYFDTEGSDNILNAIITETNRSSTVINASV